MKKGDIVKLEINGCLRGWRSGFKYHPITKKWTREPSLLKVAHILVGSIL